MAQDINQLRGEKFSHELQRMDIYGIGAPDLQVKRQIETYGYTYFGRTSLNGIFQSFLIMFTFHRHTTINLYTTILQTKEPTSLRR